MKRKYSKLNIIETQTHVVKCTICNEKLILLPDKDPICKECFDDIAQANQPSQPINTQLS